MNRMEQYAAAWTAVHPAPHPRAVQVTAHIRAWNPPSLIRAADILALADLSAMVVEETPGATALETGRFFGLSAATMALCGLGVVSFDLNSGPDDDNWFCRDPDNRILFEQLAPGWSRMGDISDRLLRLFDVRQAVQYHDGDTRRAEDWPVGCFDLVVVDDDHCYEVVSQVLPRAWGRVRPGGWLMAHDYVDVPSFGVIRAVEEFVSAHPVEGPYCAAGSHYVWWRRPEGT